MGMTKNFKVRNDQPCNWVQSEYTKSLQMLFPIYAVFHELSKNFEAPKVRALNASLLYCGLAFDIFTLAISKRYQTEIWAFFGLTTSLT